MSPTSVLIATAPIDTVPIPLPKPLKKDSPRELFLANLPRIERLVSIVARRKALSPEDTEELLGSTNLKLVDDDYAVLRQYSGRSSLGSYLAAVVTNLALDYRIKKWGKWRPSAKARRLGTTAVQLETLISRDGREVDEAIEILRRNHRAAESAQELRALAADLPVHPPRRFEDDVDFERLGEGEAPAEPIEHEEKRHRAQQIEATLNEVLDTLEPDERALVTMRFRDGLGVTEIARLLGCDRQPLYRRIYSILNRMRRQLVDRGVEPADVTSILGWDGHMIEARFESEGDDLSDRSQIPPSSPSP